MRSRRSPASDSTSVTDLTKDDIGQVRESQKNSPYVKDSMKTPTTRVPDGLPKAVTLQLSKSPYKNKKTTVATAAKQKVTPSLTRTQSRDYPEHNHRVSNKLDTNVGLESIPLSGASNSPSRRLNKLDSTDKNSTSIKNNYLDDTDSDTDSDDKDIEGTSKSPSRRSHKLNSTDNNRASNKNNYFDNTDSDDDETIEGTSNSPSRRTNKLNSTDNNRASNKNNYFDNTDSDDDETIEDDAEREQILVDDSNFEGENVKYEAKAEADACSLEYNDNNVDVNDEIMDDEEDTSHQGAGSARTVAKQSIPPLPTTLFPPMPVIDLTVFNDDDDDRRGDDN
jgi:hypothetical protein